MDDTEEQQGSGTGGELNFIRILSQDKSYYERFRPIVQDHLFSEEGLQVIADLDKWFNQGHEEVSDWGDFSSWFFFTQHPNLKPHKAAIYKKLFERLGEDSADESLLEELVETMVKRDYATRICSVAADIADGTDIKTDIDRIEDWCAEYRRELDKALEEDAYIVSEDLEGLLEHTFQGGGYDWRLPELNLACGPIRRGDLILFAARVNAGKCLGKGTPVLMFNGEVKKVEDVREGDLVMGPDSNPRVVSGCTSGTERMYRVRYGNGDYYDVNESHILSLKRTHTEGPHKYGDTLNVSVRDYLNWPEGRKNRYKGWKASIDFPENEDNLELDSYFLGVWLGDGSSTSPRVFTPDPEIIDFLVRYAEIESVNPKVNDYDGNSVRAVSLTNDVGRGKGSNPLLRKMNYLGLMNGKRIPHKYLTASRKERRKLLAGIIDTDGHKGSSHNYYEISQKGKQFSHQIVFLARSLGYGATIKEKPVNGELYYRIHLFGDFSSLPILVERKKPYFPCGTKKKGLHYGFTLEPLGEGEYYGFQVDKDGLFVLGDFTVTHNTTWLASEISFMAEQMKNGEQVVWFNNEEEGRKVKLRFFQAVIGWTLEEIRLDPMRAKDEFNKKVGGWDRFVLFDKANIHPREVERVVENSNPRLIVFDQLYKVRGWEKSSGTDVQRLHSIYQFARSLAKEYAPVIATHQASGDAAELKWLEDYMLEGCRTNIQSELDLQIMMGKTNEAGYESSRFLNIVKNKLAGGHKSDEAWRHSRHEVIIEPTIGRYRSPTE